MKLLLINPYFGQGKTEDEEVAFLTPPLGLGFIATYVRDQSDCEVEIIDPWPQKLSQEQVLEKVKKADMVGLSCFSDLRFYCFDFAQKVKKTNSRCVLMIGGPHTYFLDEEILRHYPFIDLVARGEGEETTLEIVKKKSWKDILGITFRQSKKIIRNPDRPLAADIDKYKLDYSLFPDLNLYASDIEVPAVFRKLKNTSFIASRGCPFGCTYCFNDHWKRRFRRISAGELVTRLKDLVENQGISYVRFFDDLFTADKDWVLEFCDLLKKEKLKIKFRVLVRAGTEKEVLKRLREAGCVAVGFGIESGSDQVLKIINKKITSDQIQKTLKDCQDLNLWTVGSFIISLPGETREDFQKSLVLTPKVDTFMTGILKILPYTPIYNELKKKGEIDDQIWFDQNKKGKFLYVKENFSQAPFSLKEARWLALKMKYYQISQTPKKTLEKYGLILGALITGVAGIDMVFQGKIWDLSFRFRKVWRYLVYR